MVLGELEAIPPSVIIKSRILNFWNKLITNSTPKLSFDVYKYMYNQYITDTYRSPWLNGVCQLLDECNFAHMWTNQIAHNSYSFKNIIKTIFYDNFKSKWLYQLQTSSKCHNYKLYKTKFECEKYLISLPNDHRIILCKFRTTNHKLAVELGRYSNVLRCQRFCNICNVDTLGDEFHFIFECPALNDIRLTYLDLQNGDTQMLNDIMASDSVDYLRRLTKCISIGLKRINNR